MAIRVLPEALDDLRDAASYYRALPPPKVGRELAARIFQDFRYALAAVADVPLSRQEHPEIPGVRWVHFGTFPYFAFYLVDGTDIVVVAVEHDASDYAARVQRRAAAAP